MHTHTHARQSLLFQYNAVYLLVNNLTALYMGLFFSKRVSGGLVGRCSLPSPLPRPHPTPTTPSSPKGARLEDFLPN